MNVNLVTQCIVFGFVFIVLEPVQSLCILPMVEMTERVYNAAIMDLQVYVTQAKSLPGYVSGTEPRYYIHPPGACVHGTVLVIHGFTSSANDTTIMSNFLFREGFNVIAANQAGAGRTLKDLPSTVLRESMGYAGVRAELAMNPETRTIISEFNTPRSAPEQLALIAQFNGTLVQKVENVFNEKRYFDAFNALQVMKSGLRNDNATVELHRYFETQHARHDAEAFSITQLGDVLPGPRFMLGFSLGGAYATYGAARSRDIDRAVLLAPFYGTGSDSRILSDLFTFTAFVGTLDIIAPATSWLSAAILSGTLAGRDSVTERVRGQTKVLCVIAGDDLAIDVDHSQRVCQSRMNGRSFVYPKELGLGHSITPEGGNQYGQALIQEISNFFLLGKVNDRNFLVPDNSTVL